MRKKLASVFGVMVSLFMLCSCGKAGSQASIEISSYQESAEAESEVSEESASDDSQGSTTAITENAESQIPNGEELFGLADTKEEAEKIAEQYGIILVRFSNGVATYHTDEKNLSAVIDKGKKNGWPLLEVNHYNTTD